MAEHCRGNKFRQTTAKLLMTTATKSTSYRQWKEGRLTGLDIICVWSVF